MAVRDFATTPKGILSALRRIAPDVSIEIHWEVDPYFIWDGDGPDPARRGYEPHNVDISAIVVTEEDETVLGHDTLGGVYESRGVEDPSIHGYFPQMLHVALEELHLELTGKKVTGSRKEWDPREADVETERGELATEVRAAVMFVQRSMDEIYNREQRRQRA